METTIDFNNLITAINSSCLGENYCGGCNKERCLIGYCKENLTTSLTLNEQFIDGEIDNLPLFDTKIYDNEHIIDLTGVILNQCRNCNAYHDEECIVNMLRCACEVILFGDPQDYPGSVLVYFKNISDLNSEISSKIYTSYLKHKSQK